MPVSISAFDVPDLETLDADLQKYFRICEEKLGLVPNVLRAYAFKPNRLRRFIDTYNEIMLSDESPLTKLDREMIAVVVSACNRCYYCLVAHGQQVRALSGDPAFGEQIVLNYRSADLADNQRAMLDYAWKLTEHPTSLTAEDRSTLRDHGFSDEAIWDIVETASFFNYTNRMAHGLELMPNHAYHGMDR